MYTQERDAGETQEASWREDRQTETTPQSRQILTTGDAEGLSRTGGDIYLRKPYLKLSQSSGS